MKIDWGKPEIKFSYDRATQERLAQLSSEELEKVRIISRVVAQSIMGYGLSRVAVLRLSEQQHWCAESGESLCYSFELEAVSKFSLEDLKMSIDLLGFEETMRVAQAISR